MKSFVKMIYAAGQEACFLDRIPYFASDFKPKRKPGNSTLK